MQRLDAYRAWLGLNAVQSFAGALFGIVFAVYFVQVVHMDALELVLAGTVMEAAIFVSEIPTGVFADVVGRRLSVAVGTALQGTGFVVVAAWPMLWAALAGSVVYGVGSTFTSGATEAWITDEVGGRDLERVFLRGAQAGWAAGFVGIGARRTQSARRPAGRSSAWSGASSRSRLRLPSPRSCCCRRSRSTFGRCAAAAERTCRRRPSRARDASVTSSDDSTNDAAEPRRGGRCRR